MELNPVFCICTLLSVTLAPASATELTSNAKGWVWEGEVVSMNCLTQLIGASFIWHVDGDLLPGSDRYYLFEDPTGPNSTLTISPVYRNDAGVYTCFAFNSTLNETSNALNLSVATPASATELTSSAKGWVWEGEVVSMNCLTQLIGASFIWHVNGDLLPGSDRYQLFQDPKGPNSTLTISPVYRNDTGVYTCFAFNSTLNETSNALNLSVAKPPSNPSIYCKSEAYTEQVLLGCSWAGGNPSADIKLSFNGTIKSGPDEVNWTVSLGYEVQQPELICQGNQVGKTSECKIVYERPSSSHDNNAVTSVMEGENANLTVTLNIPNTLLPTFSWFRLNPDPVDITNNEKYKVESSLSQSTLFISTVAQSEKGTYECRARNIIGSTSFKFNVEVKSQESPGSSGLSGGAIAGIVIGVIAGVALIGGGGFFLVKKLL